MMRREIITAAVSGGLVVWGIMQLFPPPPIERVSKELSAMQVKAHILCYQQVAVERCQKDSVFIDFDSIEVEYLKRCGHQVDSIAGR